MFIFWKFMSLPNALYLIENSFFLTQPNKHHHFQTIYDLGMKEVCFGLQFIFPPSFLNCFFSWGNISQCFSRSSLKIIIGFSKAKKSLRKTSNNSMKKFSYPFSFLNSNSFLCQLSYSKEAISCKNIISFFKR